MGRALAQVFDVSVVIPHYAGRQVSECLERLYGAPDRPREVILVDDASSDGSTEEAKARFPEIRVLRNPANLGFVGACNRGLAEVRFRHAVLLNDDALVESGWLRVLVEAMEADPAIAAAQPKILSARDPTRFEYAGGAGGLMDRYGYPFALGRWFERCEADVGQYDSPRDIFWASGTAMIMRMSVYREIGGLEPTFRMHMEEIDWCWRCHLMGYRVVSAPQAKVHHYGGMTLRSESYGKMYLNHRNSFLMLLKNYDWRSLLTVIPVRVLLELLTVFGSLLTGNVRRALAAAAGPAGALLQFPNVLGERRRIQATRRRSDAEVANRMYPGSIALRYLFRRPAPFIGEIG